MIGSLRLRGSALLLVACLPTLVWGNEASSGLRSGVLMGMKIDTIAQHADGTRVVTTGAEFVLEKTGRIRCFQRIPQRREVAQIEIPPDFAPLGLERQTDFACIFPARR